MSARYDKSSFKPKPTPAPVKETPKPNFDLSNILKLFTSGGFGDLSKILPNLVQNFTGNTGLSSLFNSVKPVKKVEAKVVENNFSSDSISNYERVK